MIPLTPLPMSHSKDELLRHLKMSGYIYSKMAVSRTKPSLPKIITLAPVSPTGSIDREIWQKETDRIYRWLTANRQHLKKNCNKNEPPYDWSDLLEKSKDNAMQTLASSSDLDTSEYWRLASPTVECPNWIARWFLYHTFRNRDTRNRGTRKQVNKTNETYRYPPDIKHDLDQTCRGNGLSYEISIEVATYGLGHIHQRSHSTDVVFAYNNLPGMCYYFEQLRACSIYCIWRLQYKAESAPVPRNSS